MLVTELNPGMGEWSPIKEMYTGSRVGEGPKVPERGSHLGGKGLRNPSKRRSGKGANA